MAEERDEASFGVCRDDAGRVEEVKEFQGIPEEPMLSEPEATVADAVVETGTQTIAEAGLEFAVEAAGTVLGAMADTAGSVLGAVAEGIGSLFDSAS